MNSLEVNLLVNTQRNASGCSLVNKEWEAYCHLYAARLKLCSALTVLVNTDRSCNPVISGGLHTSIPAMHNFLRGKPYSIIKCLVPVFVEGSALASFSLLHCTWKHDWLKRERLLYSGSFSV